MVHGWTNYTRRLFVDLPKDVIRQFLRSFVARDLNWLECHCHFWMACFGGTIVGTPVNYLNAMIFSESHGSFSRSRNLLKFALDMHPLAFVLEYPIGRILFRSRKTYSFYSPEIWQAPRWHSCRTTSQFSEQYENFYSETRRFEIPWDIMIKCFVMCWIGPCRCGCNADGHMYI